MTDPHAFAGAVLNPARPRLVECVRVLTGAPKDVCERAARAPDPLRAVAASHGAAALRWNGHVDPREAWEAVAPDGWAGDPRRAFAHDDVGELTAAWPRTLREALALAADPAGVATAEALAAELRDALRGALLAEAGGEPAVVWRVVAPRRLRARVVLDARLRALAATSSRDAAFEARAAAVRAACLPRVGAVALDAADVYRWGAAADAGRAFRLMLGVWSLGYAVDAVTERACVLAAPAA